MSQANFKILPHYIQNEGKEKFVMNFVISFNVAAQGDGSSVAVTHRIMQSFF